MSDPTPLDEFHGEGITAVHAKALGALLSRVEALESKMKRKHLKITTAVRDTLADLVESIDWLRKAQAQHNELQHNHTMTRRDFTVEAVLAKQRAVNEALLAFMEPIPIISMEQRDKVVAALREALK